jgi:hypothetical protein
MRSVNSVEKLALTSLTRAQPRPSCGVVLCGARRSSATPWRPTSRCPSSRQLSLRCNHSRTHSRSRFAPAALLPATAPRFILALALQIYGVYRYTERADRIDTHTHTHIRTARR